MLFGFVLFGILVLFCLFALFAKGQGGTVRWLLIALCSLEQRLCQRKTDEAGTHARKHGSPHAPHGKRSTLQQPRPHPKRGRACRARYVGGLGVSRSSFRLELWRRTDRARTQHRVLREGRLREQGSGDANRKRYAGALLTPKAAPPPPAPASPVSDDSGLASSSSCTSFATYA